MSLFTCENDCTHYTHNEDDEFRRVGLIIGAIGKSYKGRERRMTQFNKDSFSTSFESMSIRTQFSNSSNEANVYPLYMMGYDQPPQNYAMG